MKGDKLITKWKGFGRKRSCPYFKELLRHSPGGNEENHEKISVRIASLRDEIRTWDF
jgi:hypothetical protein